MFEISVTIATFKRPKLLCNILNNFIQQSVDKSVFEIIICDSYSGEETNLLIEDFKNKLNISHHHTKNILAAKRNLGISKAASDFVIFIDDDCVPEKSFIEKYLLIKNRCERKKIFCGEVRFPYEWVASSSYYRFRDSLHPKYPVKNRKMKFNNIVVMNMGFWKREFLEATGGVNEKFVGYGCEDIELGWRLINAGFELVYDGPAITHCETSNGISGYMLKIHRASRDGMKSLIKNKPEAAICLKAARILEPDFKKSFIEKLIGDLIWFSSKLNFINKLLINFLDKFDNVKIFNFAVFYRYLMLVSSAKGIRDRRFSLSEDEVDRGWY